MTQEVYKGVGGEILQRQARDYTMATKCQISPVWHPGHTSEVDSKRDPYTEFLADQGFKKFPPC